MCSLGGAALELRTASAGTCHATGAEGIRVCFEETSHGPGGGSAGVQGGLVGRVELLQPLLHAHRNTTTGADDFAIVLLTLERFVALPLAALGSGHGPSAR